MVTKLYMSVFSTQKGLKTNSVLSESEWVTPCGTDGEQISIVAVWAGVEKGIVVGHGLAYSCIFVFAFMAAGGF